MRYTYGMKVQCVEYSGDDDNLAWVVDLDDQFDFDEWDEMRLDKHSLDRKYTVGEEQHVRMASVSGATN